MRQYRGKTLDGEWVYGWYLKNNEGSFIVSECETSNDYGEETDLYATEWYQVDPKTVGQYTGENLKDGTEVYEGDVYQYEIEISIGDYSKKSYHTDTVYFKDGIYWVGGFTLHEAIENEDGKIIGNIHDNPELLKS